MSQPNGHGAQQHPARSRLFAVWSRLPDTPLSENELERAVLRTLDGPAREADASALSALLLGAEAVVAIRNEAGEVVYRKAETFPTWPEQTGPGSASYDAHLRELAAREEADHDRVAADVERRAPQNLQRAELDAHVRSVMRELLRVEVPALVRQSMR